MAVFLGCLLINTCMRSKLDYLYLTAGVFFAEKIFAISTPILQSWSFFCNPKLFGTPYYNDTCPTIESSSDLTFVNKMTFASEVMILIAYFFQNVKKLAILLPLLRGCRNAWKEGQK